MPQLCLRNGEPSEKGHRGEIFACAFSPDGKFVLSGGWDGYLRWWDGSKGVPIAALSASPKALSSCAVSPGDQHWLSGSLEGILSSWDPAAKVPVINFLAHTRPISAIVYSPDGGTLATSSWDRTIMIWSDLAHRQGECLKGHEDIVSGCRFSPEGGRLLSWSHDGSIRLWNLNTGSVLCALAGHRDRVNVAAISPDCCWVASGGRDHRVVLWDLPTQTQRASTTLEEEVHGCFFLPDGENLVVMESQGRVALYTVPDLKVSCEMDTQRPIQCADLSPQGQVLALGGTDGQLYFVEVQGLDQAPRVVIPVRSQTLVQGRLDRLLGRRHLIPVFSCTCTRCHQVFAIREDSLGKALPCPQCGQLLRISWMVKAQNHVQK